MVVIKSSLTQAYIQTYIRAAKNLFNDLIPYAVFNST